MRNIHESILLLIRETLEAEGPRPGEMRRSCPRSASQQNPASLAADKLNSGVLWPDGSLDEHREDIDRYLSGDRRQPAEVFLAIAADSMPVGFAELSIRNIVDGCSTDHVAYLEGWFVTAEARRQGISRPAVPIEHLSRLADWRS
jgi:hypothetical protein